MNNKKLLTTLSIIITFLGLGLAIFALINPFYLLNNFHNLLFLLPVGISMFLIIPAEIIILLMSKKRQRNIYIEYPEDCEFAKNLITNLKQRTSLKIRSVLDLNIGDNICETITEWISISDVIVVIFSNNSEYNDMWYSQYYEYGKIINWEQVMNKHQEINRRQGDIQTYEF